MNETFTTSLFDWVAEVTSENGTTHVEEVRASYFSICVKLSPGGWKCGIKSPSAQELAGVTDPLDLVDTAHRFRTKTVTPGLM